MPLANDGGRVAGLPEKFRKRLLTAIEEAIAVVPVEVGIFPVRIVVRLGPHSELVTRPGLRGSGNWAILFLPKQLIVGITENAHQVWHIRGNGVVVQA